MFQQKEFDVIIRFTHGSCAVFFSMDILRWFRFRSLFYQWYYLILLWRCSINEMYASYKNPEWSVEAKNIPSYMAPDIYTKSFIAVTQKKCIWRSLCFSGIGTFIIYKYLFYFQADMYIYIFYIEFILKIYWIIHLWKLMFIWYIQSHTDNTKLEYNIILEHRMH